MGIYSGLENEAISQGGVYFLPGMYRVEVLEVKSIKSQLKGNNCFIVECRILESSNADRMPGMTASWVVNVDKKMGPPNVKQFIAAVSGVSLEDQKKPTLNELIMSVWREHGITDMEQVAEAILGPDQPVRGVELTLEAKSIQTRAGAPFTKHVWAPAA